MFLARSVTYFENGGRLEGVIDLAPLLGAGFTNALFLAAAPYGTADGGALVTAAQAPAGNGDGDLLGTGEFVRLDPGDADGDGINDLADPDANGDGLNDDWATAHELAGTGADDDDDGAANVHEYRAGTDPTNPASAFKIAELTATGLVWSAVFGKDYVLEVSGDQGGSWAGWSTNAAPTNFPESLVHTPRPAVSSGWYRLRIAP